MTGRRLEPVEAYRIIARDGDVYIAAQPEERDLDAWAEAGAKTVINFRTRQENASLPYDAHEAMAARGIAYVEIPMGGADGVSPAVTARLTEVLAEAARPVVLHCASGPRAACAYAAHLLSEGLATPAEIADFGWPGGLKPDVLSALLPR